MSSEAQTLQRSWTLWMKSNNDCWNYDSFKSISKIYTIQDMWKVMNNIPASVTGKVNLFFMEGDMVPLWEQHNQVFAKGGCWSTIIKGVEWNVAMKEIVMTLFGESKFDENEVKGLCIVPVSFTHSIIKIWTTICSDKNGKLLKEVLCKENCCLPRFKAFM